MCAGEIPKAMLSLTERSQSPRRAALMHVNDLHRFFVERNPISANLDDHKNSMWATEGFHRHLTLVEHKHLVFETRAVAGGCLLRSGDRHHRHSR